MGKRAQLLPSAWGRRTTNTKESRQGSNNGSVAVSSRHVGPASLALSRVSTQSCASCGGDMRPFFSLVEGAQGVSTSFTSLAA